jgi:hypothetical protein
VAEEPSSAAREVRQEIVLSVLLGGVAPLVIYSLLRPHTTEIRALIVAAAAPVLLNVISFVRKRTLDVFGVFILAGIVLAVAAALLGGSPKIILIRDSFISGATGIIFLVSLLYRRPLIYYFSMHFGAGDDPERRAEWAQNWTFPYFRYIMRLMTAVWGIATIVEAFARGYLVLRLPTQTFLAVSPFVQYGILGGTIAWTIWYARHARRVAEQMRQERLAWEAGAAVQNRVSESGEGGTA